MELTQKEKEKIEDIRKKYMLTYYFFDLTEVIDEYDPERDGEDLREYLEKRIDEVEVIYYNVAMAVLDEHDQSLRRSLEIAAGLGYSVEQLNSELLATLLVREMLREEMEEYLPEVEAVLAEV